MASGVHSSLCDYVAGVGSLEDGLVGVDLLSVQMLDNLVMVVMQKSQSLLVQQAVKCSNVPCNSWELSHSCCVHCPSFDSNKCTISSPGSLP
jgi:hypothetical protein